MANKKISALPNNSALTGTEELPVVQGGVTVRASVNELLALVVDSAPGALNTLDELAAALGDDANYAATIASALALKAPLASPALTGHPTGVTESAGDNSTRLATTAYADAKVADAINDSTTGIAPSQNAVFDALALKAAKASNLSDLADAATARANLGAAAAGAGYVTGDRHCFPWVTTNTRTVAQGNLFLVPYFVRSAVTIDRLFVEISTVGTGSTVVRLGIWNHDATTGKPGTLLLDAGTVSGLALAEVGATISQPLTTGWVWLGCAAQTVTGSPAVRGFGNGIGPSPLPTIGAISSALVAPNCLLVTGQTGAFGTLVGASFSSASATGPQIQLRVA